MIGKGLAACAVAVAILSASPGVSSGGVVAPLSVDSHGSVDRDVDFNGTTFPGGTELAATFRFDSCRLTWRRKLLARDAVDASTVSLFHCVVAGVESRF